jgi:hypothetical protein
MKRIIGIFLCVVLFLALPDASRSQSAAEPLIPAATVGTVPWSSRELSGTWNVTTVISGYIPLSSVNNETPLPATYPHTWTVTMLDDAVGTISSSWAGFSGALTYREGVVRAVMTIEGYTDIYDGRITLDNGTITLSGTYYDQQKQSIYTGTWTAAIAE